MRPVAEPMLVQRRLRVGAVNDPAEREADSVADDVIRRLRQAAPRAHETTASDGSVAGLLRRRPADSTQGEARVDNDTERAIRGAMAGGRPLDAHVRRPMENAFGADFGAVRVHAGSRSRTLNDCVRATAFTTGRHIFFRDGIPSIDDPAGQGLLAHELAHTVQQGAAPALGDIRSERPPAVVQRRANPAPWDQVKPGAVAASSAGAKGGVFFVKLNGTRHVIKASTEIGATMFGERMVDKIMGGEGASANSIPIPRTDNEFHAILAAIERGMPADDKASQDRLAEFKKANALLIQTDLAPGRSMIGKSVASDLKILQNPKMMQTIGRMLAVDTLVGNADRFETMNTGNAFLGDVEIGFLDTEAIMQSYGGFKIYTDKDATGTAFAGQGVARGGAANNRSDSEAYVDFLLEGGNELVADDGTGVGVAPSPNAKSLTTDLTRQVKNMAYAIGQNRPPLELQQFAQAGYVMDTYDKGFTTSKWITHALVELTAGFDGAVRDIHGLLAGADLGEAKTDFDKDVQDHGATPNFDFMAFQIRGNIMAAMKAGKDYKVARQEAVNFVDASEGPQPSGLDVANRVIDFGVTKKILTKGDQLQLQYYLPSVDQTKLREEILHVRGGKAKFGHKLLEKVPAVDMQYLENRLEAIRGGMLKFFLGMDPITNPVAVAEKHTVTKAQAIRKADVHQFRYVTKTGERNAKVAVASLGLDTNRWF